jgi:hypothetical protein
MKTPASSYVTVLTAAYAVGLFVLFPLASMSSESNDMVLTVGPIVLTVLFLVGRFLVLRSISAVPRAGATTANGPRTWVAILVVYLLLALLGAGVNGALSGGQLK